MDADTNKILVIDSEEMVLDTIETFYPDDEAELYIASSLSDALKTIEEHDPAVIVTTPSLPDAQGDALINKLRSGTRKPEIILTSTLDSFKDTLSEFGSSVSDVVFKPIDMDILETIIGRARTNISLKNTASSSKDDSSKQQEETNILKNNLMEMKNKAQNLEKENVSLKEQLQEIEKQSESTKSSADEEKNKASKEISELQENKNSLDQRLTQCQDEQKSVTSCITATVNAVRTAKIKTSVAEVFVAFEDNIKKIPGVTGVKITTIDQADAAKINAYTAKIKAGEICIKSGEKIEIPFPYGNNMGLAKILGDIDVAIYNPILHVFREGLILSLTNVTARETFASQLEAEKKQITNVKTIFGNVQMYINKTDADSKVNAVKDELNKTFEDILNICFDAQDAINKIENKDDAAIKDIQSNIEKITTEKAQNFDIFIQKIAHITEVLANIKLGMAGKRMQAISGDQFLFADERKQA